MLEDIVEESQANPSNQFPSVHRHKELREPAASKIRKELGLRTVSEHE